MADVNASIKNWSSTESSNSPAGATVVGTGMDDNLRQIQATIVQDLNSKGADIASATTTDLGAIPGLYHDITGTTTITGFGTVRAGVLKVIQFDGALTLTHNATSLILPGAANITTVAGDKALCFSHGSGNWEVLMYTRYAALGTAATKTVGVAAGNVVQVDQAVTATTRSATTTLGTTLNHTLSDTSTTITAFNGVAGVTYRCRTLGAGAITHHATDLIITQTGASIAATAAGDTFDVYMITATTSRVLNYTKADGTAVVPPDGYFNKSNSAAPAFTKTGAGTISVLAGTSAMVAGTLVPFAADTAVVMPSLTAGTDYAIYFCTDGTVRADANFSAPSGYTTANSRKIGGFHYAPGGNATGTSGGDTTPAINQYSIWDLKFRPTCPDPRGMALVADGFWSDIYLLGVDHPTNGTSKYNVTIADGSSPPKLPTKFGGNGTTAYAGGNWWDLHETLRAYGKRHPTYSEFAALAYGTTEASSSGTDPVSTILRQAYTSKWGVMLAAGNMFVWGDEFGGGAAAASWTANTGGRGSTYQMENAVRFGGNWSHAADAGSRCSVWSISPTFSGNDVGARGVCDHLQLD